MEEGLAPWMRFARADGYDLYLNRLHKFWVEELEADFEMRWSSLWQDRAPDPFGVIAGFGVRWPWINFDCFNANPLEWRGIPDGVRK